MTEMTDWNLTPDLLTGFEHWANKKDEMRILRHFPVFLSFPIILAERPLHEIHPAERLTATGLLLPSPIGDEIGEGYTVFTILYTRGPLFCSSAQKIIIVDGVALPILEMWSTTQYPEFRLTLESLLEKGNRMLNDLQFRLSNLHANLFNLRAGFEFGDEDYPVLLLSRH